jgi:putative hydrolase of the HAD superfamily
MQILMDLDDTLVNHSKAQRVASARFGELFQGEIPGYSRDSFESDWNRIMEKYYRKFLARKLSFEEQRQGRIRELFARPGMSPETAEKLFGQYLNLYEKAWKAYEDVVPFLEWCASRSHPVAILTDGSQEQQNRKIELTCIASYFTYVFTAEEEKRAKPDPLFFTGVCEKLGVHPSAAIYIGDNREKDAVGAANAGLTGIWLDRENRDPRYTGLRVTDLYRLKTLIESRSAL